MLQMFFILLNWKMMVTQENSDVSNRYYLLKITDYAPKIDLLAMRKM